MRISDWSSDVCSSDLLHGDRPLRRDELVQGFGRTDTHTVGSAFAVDRQHLADAVHVAGDDVAAQFVADQGGAVQVHPTAGLPLAQGAQGRSAEGRRAQGRTSTCNTWWCPLTEK